jgi:hypothetical protein
VIGTDPAVLKVGNASGFYGDRLSAMHEMLVGGDLDVVTGDYLAELTMLILGRDRLRDPSLGYARTFVKQAEECLGVALEQGVRIVSNAGGLNPAGLAGRLREVASGLGLSPRIAYVHGDDLLGRADELDLGAPLTANAYLGGLGIARALDGGADLVVTGRVTDASLVVGPAVAHFGWSATDYDALAGAVVAGHVIECGAQACGGNFSGFGAMPHDATPLGFPLAEIAADGSSVITKHPDTGGVVSADTVTAQLVYEIQSQRYLGPDVTARLDTIDVEDLGDDRVRLSAIRGEAPPARLKVCVNELGGYRNGLEFVLVGLDIEEKAAWVREQLEARLQGRHRPASVEWSLARTDREDADTEEQASCLLRLAVRDPDADVVGRAFTAAAVELGLASYPGFSLTAPPAPATPYGVYRPAYVDRAAVAHTVVHHDGTSERIEDPPLEDAPHDTPAADGGPDGSTGEAPATSAANGNGGPAPDGSVPVEVLYHDPAGVAAQTPKDVITRRLPLGTFVHARSGDKGGDANIGLWVDRSRHADERIAWLTKLITPERIQTLLPETKGLDIEVYTLPNLGAVNVMIRGLLGDGVAASSRFDPQAKGLGEWLRSRLVSIDEGLL